MRKSLCFFLLGACSAALCACQGTGPVDMQKSRADVPDYEANLRPSSNPNSKTSNHTRMFEGPRPNYPKELRELGVQGRVDMAVRVGKDGRVVEARVVKSADRRLDEAALEAVKQWRVKPTRDEKGQVRTSLTPSITFRIERGEDQ